MRAMLFYIDEFPERLHHPKESDLLFPKVVRVAPGTMDAVKRLEQDHMRGESSVRELQHALLAWELLGESRRERFETMAKNYVGFYLEHMHLEESVILPEAEKALGADDWKELDAAFAEELLLDQAFGLHRRLHGRAGADALAVGQQVGKPRCPAHRAWPSW
jgi:hemerythrin-like domain-containing protein